MHRPDSSGAVAGRFSEGNELATPKVLGTVLGSKYQNSVLEELVYVVEGAGLVLDEDDDTQVGQALVILVRQETDKEVAITAAPRTVAQNEGFIFGATWGWARAAAAVGTPVIAVVVGQSPLQAKAVGPSFSIGDAVYWDDVAHECTDQSAGNYFIGFARSTYASGATSMRVHRESTRGPL